MLPVPSVRNAFDEQGKPPDERMEKRLHRFFHELDWYAKAWRTAREAGKPA
jgi:hypothetical protein